MSTRATRNPLLAVLVLASLSFAPLLHAQAPRKTGHAAPSHVKAQPNPQLLPPAFASLPRQGDIVDMPSAADADPAHQAVLTEDGFAGASRATYRGDGKAAWSVEVLRFEDATGAYSAFTFYRDPSMRPEKPGDESAASGNLFLMRAGTSLVLVRPAAGPAQAGANATANAATLGSAAKGLLAALPRIGGSAAISPSLPNLLPPAHLDAQTVHYAIGPASYNGPIPVGRIDFGRDVEAITASYRLPSGRSARLTLLMAPTPQIAHAQADAIRALPDAALHAGVRRLGPLVGAVSGAGVSPAEANALLASLHYKTDLTMDQPQGYTSEVAKAAKLLVGIAQLTGVIAFAALFVGISLGAGRVLIRRMRGKPDSSVYDEEFISLKL